jgi:hypothetical protein
MNGTLEVSGTQARTRELLSAFSGLAVLALLVTGLFASAFIASSRGVHTPDLNNAPLGTLRGDPTPTPRISFYLVDSQAQFEEVRELAELVADVVEGLPIQSPPRVVTLFAHTAEEEALANARIVAELLSSKGEPRSIEVIDLRAQTVK